MAQKKTNLVDAEDLRPIFKFLGKNWYLLLSLPLIGFAVAYYHNYKQADIYAAKTEILLKSSETYDYQNQIYSNLGYYSILADITNQQRILQSYDIISETLDRVDFDISYFLVGRFTDKAQQETHFDAFDVDFQVASSKSKLFGKPINITVLSLYEYQLSYTMDGILMKKTYRFGDYHDEPDYTIKLTAKPGMNQQTIEGITKLGYQIRVQSRPKLVKQFQRALSIQKVEYTSILTLKCNHVLESRAKQFLDTLSVVYIENTLESQFAVNENTEKYIDKQLVELEVIMDSLESQLESFKEQRNILDIDREKNEYFEDLIAYESEKRKLELRIQSMSNLEEFLYRDDASLDAMPPTVYFTDEDFFPRQLITELFDLRQARQLALIDVQENSVTIQRKDSLINATKASLRAYARDTRNGIREQIAGVTAQIRKLESKLQGIPKTQRDILGINRKLKVNESLYVFLLEKKANTVIARAAILPQTSVIENARGIGIVGPNKSKNVYSAVGIGFFIALLIGFIRLIFFERIENTRELKDYSTIPVIGGIPSYDEIDEEIIVINHSPRSNVAEAFRSVRTNLQYILTNDSTKVILVTSLHPGEGKTFTCSNLASVIAKAGKKTIVVDFDMHKPRIHKNFGISNHFGVSSYLIGKNNYRDNIAASQTENLDILTAGPIPHNASELVMNQKVKELIDELSEQYEYIFIDTPPLMLISDAIVLLKHADAGLFVMNTEKATKQGVRYLKELLANENMASASLLLNNIKQKRWKYYYSKYSYKYGYSYSYGYSYGYGYGYGYGHGEAPKNQKRKKRSKRQSNS